MCVAGITNTRVLGLGLGKGPGGGGGGGDRWRRGAEGGVGGRSAKITGVIMLFEFLL